jgi:hypothetical protein
MATRTWRGTTSVNWGTSTNWLEGAVPVNTDDVIFDATSSACTVNVTGACSTINFTAYTNTITMTNTITVGTETRGTTAALSFGSSMNVSGSSAINVRRCSVCNITTNGFIWPNNLGLGNVAAVTGTTDNDTTVINLNDNLRVTGLVTLNLPGVTGNNPNLSLVSIGSARSLFCGSLSVSIATDGSNRIITSSGGTKVVFSYGGTWSQSLGPSSSFNVDVDIDCSGNTLTIGTFATFGSTSATRTLKYISGTVVCTGTFAVITSGAGGANVTLDTSGSTATSATTTSTSGINFSTFSIRPATNVAANNILNLSSPICVVSTLQFISRAVVSADVIPTINNSFIYLNGSLTKSIGACFGTTVIVAQNTGSVTWTDNRIADFRRGLCSATINCSGTITFSSNFGFWESTLTYITGTVIPPTNLRLSGGVTLVATGVTWTNIIIAASTADLTTNYVHTITGNHNLTGNLTFNNATSTTTVNGSSLLVGSSFSLPSLTTGIVQGTATVELQGSGTTSMSSVTTGVFRNNLIINTAGNTHNFTGTFRFGGTMTFTSGSINSGTSTLVAVGDTTFFDMSGVSWYNLTFLSSALNSIVTINTSELISTNTATLSYTSTNSHTFSGNNGWNVNNLRLLWTSVGGNKLITLNSGSTYTINSSVILITTSANTLSFASSSSTNRAKFTLQQGATQDLYYIGSGSGATSGVDSSGGQTVYTRKGVIVEATTTNWRLWSAPTTVASSFLGE